jgi:hypothetical protein
MTSQDAASPGAEPVVPSQSQGPKQPSTASPGTQIRIGILVMGIAMLAGVAAWLVGEYTLDYFMPSRAAAENFRDSSALNREMPGVNALNGAVNLGTFGGLLGLALGIAGGLSRRSSTGAEAGAVAGWILGIVAGALPSLVVLP